MHELRASCMGFDRIVATLNAEGVPTRTTEKKRHGFAVNQILRRAMNAEENRTQTTQFQWELPPNRYACTDS